MRRQRSGAAPDAVLLGVVLAGGQNRRYGSHKALERVGGVRIIERAIGALREACDRVVVVANDEQRYRPLGVPVRPDLQPGCGTLGGIHTAVRWAEEEGRAGALCVACDMPFLSGALLRELARRSSRPAVVVPESDGPRGVEPLCAAYGVETREAIEVALAGGERAVISFYDAVDVRRVPRQVVARFGDPRLLFLNVNTPEERARAEAALAAGTAEPGG